MACCCMSWRSASLMSSVNEGRGAFSRKKKLAIVDLVPRNEWQSYVRRVLRIVQHALVRTHELRVAFVVAARVQVAIVFRKCSRCDRDAQAMSGRNHNPRKPEIEVVAVHFA